MALDGTQLVRGGSYMFHPTGSLPQFTPEESSEEALAIGYLDEPLARTSWDSETGGADKMKAIEEYAMEASMALAKARALKGIALAQADRGPKILDNHEAAAPVALSSLRQRISQALVHQGRYPLSGV